MIRGILINVNPGKTKSVLETIRKIEAVKYILLMEG